MRFTKRQIQNRAKASASRRINNTLSDPLLSPPAATSAHIKSNMASSNDAVSGSAQTQAIPRSASDSSASGISKVEVESTIISVTADEFVFNFPSDYKKSVRAIRKQTIRSYDAMMAKKRNDRDLAFFHEEITLTGSDPFDARPVTPVNMHAPGAWFYILSDGHYFNFPTDPLDRVISIRDQVIRAYRAFFENGGQAEDRALIFWDDVDEEMGILASGGQPSDNEKMKQEELRVKNLIDPEISASPAVSWENFGPSPAEWFHRGTAAAALARPGGPPQWIQKKRSREDIDKTQGLHPHAQHATDRPSSKRSKPDHSSSVNPITKSDKSFVGDYQDLSQFHHGLEGRSLSWAMGKYLNGHLSIKGNFAKTRAAKVPCKDCKKRGDQEETSCRFLVKGQDAHLVSKKCGNCLEDGLLCLDKKGRKY